MSFEIPTLISRKGFLSKGVEKTYPVGLQLVGTFRSQAWTSGLSRQLGVCQGGRTGLGVPTMELDLKEMGNQGLRDW